MPKERAKYNKETKKTITRLLLAGGLTVGAVLGYAAYQKSERSQQLVPTPIQIDDNFLQHYPELRNNILYQKGELDTEFTSLTWLNFTSKTVNPQFLKNLYNFIETNTKGGFNITVPFNERGNVEFNIKVRERQNRLLFLIPEQADIPWWTKSLTRHPGELFEGASTQTPENGPYFSFVRLRDKQNIIPDGVLNTPDDRFINTLATEICQSTVMVSYNADSFTQSIGQEMFCNSVGRAVLFKSKGESFENYYRYAQNVPFRPYGDTAYYQIPMSEGLYNQIPTP